MSTALVLGNGKLLVNINNRLNLSDIYWPHVGQENHLAKEPNSIFLRINGHYTYLTDSSWIVRTEYIKDSLVGSSVAINKKYNIEVEIKDFVLPDRDVFVRIFNVRNLGKRDLDVQVYLKNNFYMIESDVGNTATWYPLASVMVHYKKNRYIGVGSSEEIYQFSCAGPLDNNNKGCVPGLNTGELANNPVSTGSVQSCISHKFQLKPDEEYDFDSFMVCGQTYDEIKKLSDYVRVHKSKHLLETTEQYWKNWVRSKVDNYFQSSFPIVFTEKALNEKLFNLYKRSLLVIRTQFDNDGAIMAANDSTFVKAGGKDTYSYFWPRDGAMISLALIEVGFGDLVKNFFRFCKSVLTKEGYILHKFYPNIQHGLASSWHPWVDKGGNLQLPIQEDETALVIYALWKHYERFADQEFLNEMWDTFVVPASNFLVNYRYDGNGGETNISDFVSGYKKVQQENPLDGDYIDSGLPKPSYDIWEQDRGINTYTNATVYAGLLAAANLAKHNGHEDEEKKYTMAAEEIKSATVKHLFDNHLDRFVTRIYCDPVQMVCIRDTTTDAALVSLWSFDMFSVNDPMVISTMRDIEEKLWLKTDIGGMARKESDLYHQVDKNIPGNPWFISTLWMAQYYLKRGELEKSRKFIAWVLDHADSSGLIAEQADPNTGFAVSVKPLTWSHAELVRTVNMLVSTAN